MNVQGCTLVYVHDGCAQEYKDVHELTVKTEVVIAHKHTCNQQHTFGVQSISQ